jgi:very-short-patch-repair endonuclease
VSAELISYRELAQANGRARIHTGLRHGSLTRASRGIYAAAPVLDDDRVRALFMRLPTGSVLGFQSAAARHGFGVLRTDRTHVIIPPTAAKPRIRGVVAHHAVLTVIDQVIVAGVPCAPPARSVVDLARTVRRMDALPVIDAALRAGACDRDDLLVEAERHRGLRGIRRARHLIPFGDPRAECRQESQLRQVLIDARLPVPEPQVWVDDGFGAPRYRVDLGYRCRKVGLEYDGGSHAGRERLRADRTRMNWLAAQGWVMRYFTDRDLYASPAGIVGTVRAALATRPCPTPRSCSCSPVQ